MPSYYDIDPILADEHIVPCATNSDFAYLGHLDKTTGSLPAHTRLRLPLWAVRAWSNLGYCRISVPVEYSQKAREQVAADPVRVDLRCVTNMLVYL